MPPELANALASAFQLQITVRKTKNIMYTLGALNTDCGKQTAWQFGAKMKWHNPVQHGASWCNIVGYGMAQYGAIWYGHFQLSVVGSACSKASQLAT